MTAPENPQTMADVLFDGWDASGEVGKTQALWVQDALTDGYLDGDPDTCEAVDASYERRNDVAGFMQRLREGWSPARIGERNVWVHRWLSKSPEPMAAEHAALYRRGEK